MSQHPRKGKAACIWCDADKATDFLAQIEQPHMPATDGDLAGSCFACSMAWPCDAIRGVEKLKACMEAIGAIQKRAHGQADKVAMIVLMDWIREQCDQALARAKEEQWTSL